MLGEIIIGIGSGIAAAILFTYRIGNWKGVIDTKISGIEKDIIEIKKNINEYLILPKVMESKSPLHLNEMGKKIQEEIGTVEMAKEIAPVLRESVKDKVPYEIQEICFNFIEKEYKMSRDIEKRFLNSAYNHGLGRYEVAMVLAIDLRDTLLKEEGHV